LTDVFRATLAQDSGNRGYLGLAPDGTKYHVVVPVDVQIARGVKAGNRPDDGTPFGGYAGWHYFECRPFTWPDPDEKDEQKARWNQARPNAKVLTAWAFGLGLEVIVVEPGQAAQTEGIEAGED
ncbi:MAG: hypothetical protein JRJ59_07455, partial [Deltaproteobacteria bacterium]|nr:hypothetical protein [Deltaproteobacteria bacterium]